MGFRLQRRIKLFGGFGFNFSKTGISWSDRGPIGSVGPKGYRIRTPLKGLSYVDSFKTSKKRSKSSQKPVVIFWVFICSLVILLFNSYPKLFLYILLAIVFIIILLSLKLLIDFLDERKIRQNNELKTDEVSDLQYIQQMNNIEPSTVFNPNTLFSNEKSIENTPRLNLEYNIQASIINICEDISDIVNEAYCEPDIAQKFSLSELMDYTIYDLCRLFSHFNISLSDSKKERDIILVSCGFFFDPQINAEILNNQKEIFREFTNSLNDIMLSPHPLGYDADEVPYVLPVLLKNHSEYFTSYKYKLLEFANLITTVDYKLTKEESKIIEVIKSL